MPAFSGKGTGRGRLAAVAVTLGAVLALTACSEQAPADTTPAGGTPGATGTKTTGGTTTTSSQGIPAIIAPSGPLDTTDWVLAPPFYGSGDEPFWRLDIVDGWFSFSRSALRAIEEPLVQPRKESGADVFETGGLKVTIQSSQCETQGRQSEFIATVVYDDVTYDGCVFIGSVGSPGTELEFAL